jgi:hypothetical protein
LFQGKDELPQWLFCGIAPHHEIHLRVTNQLLVKIRGGVAAEDDGSMGMVFFAEGGNLQGALGMGKPVEVDAEGFRMEPGDELFGIEIFFFEHPQGQIDDAYMDSIPLQMLGDGGEAHRVHLENGRGRDEVTDGPEEDRELTEIINRRSVQEDQIRLGEHFRSNEPFHHLQIKITEEPSECKVFF